jgi:hypothetical protein
VKPLLLSVLVKELHQLVVRRVRLGWALPDRMRHAVLEMIAKESTANATQGLLYRRDLHEDVGTIAIGFDHLLQPAHLTLDATKAVQVLSLEVFVNGDGLAASGVQSASARRRGSRSFT